MGFFDWLFGDTTPANTTTTTKNELPPWLAGASEAEITEAMRLMGQPYQSYPGPRQAPLNSDQQAGMQYTRDIQGQGAQRTQGAYDLSMGSGRSFDINEINSYINPYVQQVAGNTERELERRNQQQRLVDNYRANQAGAFGGTGRYIVDAERERNMQTTVGDLYSKTYSDAFDKGVGQFNTQRQLENQAGIAGSQQSAGLQNQQYQDVAQRLGIGGMLQDQTQANYNQGFQDWEAQRKYPYDQLGFLSNLIQGAPYSQTQTQTQPGTPTPGFFQQAAGLGIAALGAFR